jgi:hypothetical protein
MQDLSQLKQKTASSIPINQVISPLQQQTQPQSQPQSQSASAPTRENILANIQALMDKAKGAASQQSMPVQPSILPKSEPKIKSERESLIGSIRDTLKVVDRNVERQELQKKQKEAEEAKKQKEKEEFQKMMEKLRGNK